jgi:hypothetical protein
MMRVSIARFVLVASIALAPLAVSAQTVRTGTLQVTVVDPSQAVIAGATVTVAGAEPATKLVMPAPVQTSAQGIATVQGLAPGRYTVKAEFPGFQTRQLPNVQVRAGDNRQVVLLPIEAVSDTVTAEDDRQQAAADPRGPSFGTTLTREQLDALSDDPEELRRQLQEMAGPGAVIKVDSFEGGALPTKAQIRSIRISRDQFAAENHSAGGISVEIITQPGLGPIRYNTGFRFRGGSLSGRSPFTPTKGPEQIRNFFMGVNGTLIEGKSSFNLYATGMSAYETPAINVALADGNRAENVRLRTPRDNLFVNANVDYALTVDQTLRFGYNMSRFSAENLGVGEYDEEGRAYSTENSSHTLRVQHMGPLARRAFMRTRLQLSWSDSSSRSVLEAPTIRVIDAFNTGGAQVAGGQHTRTFSAGGDLDYVRGPHTFRTGLLVDGSWIRADDTSNYLGTYTFESLEAFLDNRPRSYTRRLGDPRIRYRNLQAAWYLQDDLKVRRNLTASAGVRYEAQTHVGDYLNLGPRLGLTWAPFASGRTTLRSSWGIFYDWLPSNTYEQTLRVDGFRQQELNIVNPTYPELTEGGTVPPVNRYVLASLDLPRNSRVSLGVDQRLTRAFQASAVYSYQRGGALLRGLNLNAPMDGVRPDPLFGNIVEVTSDASSRQHQLQLNLTVNPGALLPVFNAPLVNWKRTTVFLNYTFADLRNNAEGAFGVPSTGDLAQEWGPAGGDIRHRLNVQVNNQIVRNLLVAFNVSASSGAPYTIRTGLDENGDLIFNDRPGGVGRNTERGAGQWSINPAVAYTFLFGRLATALPPGVAVIAAGGAPTVRSVEGGTARYRLQLFLQVQNLTNHPNYTGYSGTLTSPFFGRATAVSGMRKVDAGLSLNF